MITYNNKDILKSFIGNKRVIKKYLNNKIVYGIPDFAQYYNIQGYDNYEVVGNPTIVNGIVSGIKDKLDFITVDTHSVSNTAAVELFLILHNTTQYAGVFNISDFLNARVTLNNTYGILLINKNGTTISSIPRAEIEWKNAVNLYINLQRSPLTDSVYNYTFRASLDGTNWVSKTVSDETNFFGSIIRFGCTNNSYGSGFQVQYTLDLNNTYIKVNEKYMFNGNQNYKELLWCNPKVYLQPNGKAYINTGVPSNAVTQYKIDYRITDSSIRIMACGADVSFRNKSDTFIGIANSGLYWYYGTGNSAYHVLLSKSSEYYLQKNRLEVNYSSTSATASIYNNIEQISSYTTTASELSSNTYYLFGLNRNGTATLDGSLCIYSAQYYGSNINKYLVPVPQGLQIGSYKVPSNGMFDIVEQKFYENKGSGEFIWGVDL